MEVFIKYKKITAILPTNMRKRVLDELEKQGIRSVSIANDESHGIFPKSPDKSRTRPIRIDIFAETYKIEKIVTFLTKILNESAYEYGLVAIIPVEKYIVYRPKKKVAG